MRQADYNNPKLYNKSEDRAAIMLDDAHHVQILGLNISFTGGDGITLTGYEPASSNIYLADLILDRCYRNALSVISVENMTLERAVLTRTGQVYGTRPMYGIDFEPNHYYQRLSNITIRDVEISHNVVFGADLNIGHLNYSTAPIGVTFDNVSFVNNSRGMQISAGGDSMGGIGPPVRGYVVVTRSHFSHSRLVALAIDGSTTSSATVSVVDTSISDSPSLPFITGAEEYPECERWNDSESWCKLDTRCRWFEDKRHCSPYISPHGNTTAVFVFARGTAGSNASASALRTRAPTVADAVEYGDHAVLIQNLSVTVSGPRLNGVLDGRSLLAIDVLGPDAAVLKGSVSLHVPHSSLCCPTLVSAKGAPQTVAQLNVTCVVDAADGNR